MQYVTSAYRPREELYNINDQFQNQKRHNDVSRYFHLRIMWHEHPSLRTRRLGQSSQLKLVCVLQLDAAVLLCV